MIIVYDSLTGQTKRFVKKLGFNNVSILDYVENDEPILLITRSFNFGEIPPTTLNFLNQYANKVIATCVSGNKNWGTNYGMAGVKIEQMFNIPLILKFEGSGFDQDVKLVQNWINIYLRGKMNDK